MAPATFVRTAALLTVIPRCLAISCVGTRHGRFRWRRRGSGRSISRLGQPVSMLVLVGRLPILGWRGELCSADLSEVLGLGSLLLLVLLVWNVQSPSTLRSGPVDRCGDGRGQFGLLPFRGRFAGIEPRERSDWSDPNGALATSVMPPGKE